MRAESLYIDDDYQTEELFPYPSNPPAPQPPGVAKTDIYHDPLVFADIDQIAISVKSLSKLLLSCIVYSRYVRIPFFYYFFLLKKRIHSSATFCR